MQQGRFYVRPRKRRMSAMRKRIGHTWFVASRMQIRPCCPVEGCGLLLRPTAADGSARPTRTGRVFISLLSAACAPTITALPQQCFGALAKPRKSARQRLDLCRFVREWQRGLPPHGSAASKLPRMTRACNKGVSGLEGRIFHPFPG